MERTEEKERQGGFCSPIAHTAQTSAAKPLVYYVVWLILSLFFFETPVNIEANRSAIVIMDCY